MYYAMDAMEVSRLAHEERLEAAKHNQLVHQLELAHRLEINGSPFQQMRWLFNRMIYLFF